jgi:hypothetical protein
VGFLAAGAAAIALLNHSHHLQGLPDVLRATVAALILFAVCGDALARVLIGPAWVTFRPMFTVVLGAVGSSLALTAFGVLHVPLHVSLWLTLASGLGASAFVRRRGLGVAEPADADAAAVRRTRITWLVTLAVVFGLALLPVWRLGADTIYGQNPDAHQVAGIAVLFQHVPPTHTDTALPIDTVPAEWRFRYPIFYGLAGVSNLAHMDPIRVFTPMEGLLLVIAVFGFAMLAVECLGAPAAAGPAIAVGLTLSWTMSYLVWHPYWNQLWGTALLPYALLFGWRALAARDGRAAILCLVSLVMLWLAYPLALPYPVVILAALTAAYWQRGQLSHLRTVARARGWIWGVVALVLLTPAVVGAVIKLKQAISQLLTPGSTLWGGDIHHLLSFGRFAGTGGGVAAALAVLLVAAYGLWRLPPRPRLALGGVLASLLLLDLRFRLVKSGAYMDFKHLTFTGSIILTLAAAGLARLVWSRGRWWTALGLALATAWVVAAVVQDRRADFASPQQVSTAVFQIRQWAHRLPPGASVRVDIPPGGSQLWAVYMLGDHPVDSPTPTVGTTYAYARGGIRADYSISLRYYPNPDPEVKRPVPARLYAVEPPLFANSEFVLRRVNWPRRLDYIPDTASTRLVGS